MTSEQIAPCAVILAGGRSTRMGSNKALLELNNKTVIAGQIEELRKFFDPVIVVANQPELYQGLGVRIVPDEFPGYGPLAGIHAGLKNAPGDVVFVVPCDMPFISADIGVQMLGQLGGADGLVLEKDGHFEPLFALYTKRCLPVIEEFLRAKRLKVIDFYPLVNIEALPVEKLALPRPVNELLLNINTPEEFQQAKVFGACN